MQKENSLRKKMPFFDTFKTAAAVGLLMQQASAMYCPENSQFTVAPDQIHLSAEANRRAKVLMMDEATSVIKELTITLNGAYTMLLESTESNRNALINRLDPEKADLIELQLRGLEGAIKNVYRECTAEQRHLIKAPLLVTAQARASAAKLNNLIAQMTKPVETFVSEINRDALRELARHGTDVFVSGRVH